MSQTLRAGWACALALVLASCQDYNFNPVGHCVIQPGTESVTLSNISSADVLFVVDDSGSMGGEQAKLAANFDVFISYLDAANAARANAGLEPFDFHIAATTTSVFWNYQTANTCTSTCTGAAGALVCCKPDNTPAKQPQRCTSNAQCTVAGTTCRTDCSRFQGEQVCCAAPVPPSTTGTFPAGSVTATIPCSRAGEACGTLETHYDFGTCAAGVAVNEWPYPGGDFVSWTGASGANPRVLHFDKELYTGTKNRQGFTRTDLVSFFKGGTYASNPVQGNVIVGTCGSGEEQGLQAAKLALEKATTGAQKDTFARDSATPQPTWTAASRTANSPADWLPPGKASKLVLVFVGDEDDCSSPKDPSGGVVMLAEPAGDDACTRDATLPGNEQRQLAVASFADYFTSLGRPVGAAFIFPAAQTSCSGAACTAGPGVCCATDCPGHLNACFNDATCGAQAPGYRLLSAANELSARGAGVMVGSICDSNFGELLKGIAELVTPPSGLELPSLPAAGEVTMLRIATTSGATRKVCTGPLAPRAGTNYTLQEAQAMGVDWWFTPNGDPAAPVTGPTTFVYINPLGACIANPGETYSADYLGRLPEGGCWNDGSAPGTGSGETSADAMCRSVLGGTAGSWTCFAEDALGACNPAPTQGQPGTCICGSRANNCAP